ncbi:DUF4188 domain-containing protein [Virgisporangium aurantiacum]|uniref:DUF4188 domain-containing protein n=1 Tax=Virgisporangium aurantiacum TaxID=175570 RepID=A0A8J4E4K0_9ACTN|nr:DUF4188 domain-containing protein [Virgisporangium aurantiacum]GIJ61164.1 hypothetical protein Vau01_086800 [Virgisporangium aurantiacum]
MRTDDFSNAPPMGQATAMFVGATRYRGPLSLIRLLPRWLRLVRQMKRMRGYCWHTVYWRYPFSLGTIAFFRDRDALLLFARGSAHRDLMCWVTDAGTRHATGGYIRLYNAEPAGYTNGVWRAEENVMRHIETFSPLSTERVGPAVHR